MEEQEINKTIAEYMHPRARSAGFNAAISKKYTTSLDACIPVVEKLGVARYEFFWLPDGWVVEVGVNKLDNVEERAKSPALALSTALAKAIKEIN